MFINIYSVRLATIVQNVLTVAKIIALIIIILGGFAMLGKGTKMPSNTLNTKTALFSQYSCKILKM